MRPITKMSEEVRGLADRLPQGYEVMASTFHPHVNGADRIMFAYRCKEGITGRKRKKSITFKNEEGVFIGYEVEEYLRRLSKGSTDIHLMLLSKEQVKVESGSRFSFHTSGPAVEKYARWAYSSELWETVFRDGKQLRLVSKKTFRRAITQADSLTTTWRGFIQDFRSRGFTKRNTINAGEASPYLYDTFFDRYEDVAQAIQLMSELLLIVGYGEFESMRTSRKATFQKKLEGIAKGDMTDSKIESLVKKLRDDLHGASQRFLSEPEEHALPLMLELANR